MADTANNQQKEASNMREKPEVLVSADPKTAMGQITGLERAKQIYGMDIIDIGDQTQDIVRRRKEALDGKDPATDALRRGKNQQLRAAKASGANAGQMAQIERQAAQDIGQQEFMSQNQSLGEYQKLIGNILGGTSQMEMGMASLEKAGEMPRFVPSGGSGTVICTELHRQGYMSDLTLKLDTEHGKRVRTDDPCAYIGYIWMARPIVKLMRKSESFTSLVSIPALAWANDMAYKNSKAGNIINKIGTILCRTVGKIIVSLHKKGLCYA